MDEIQIGQIRVGTLSDKLSVARTNRAIRAMKKEFGSIGIERVLIKSDDMKDLFIELADGNIDVVSVDVAEVSKIERMPSGCENINVAALLKRGDSRNVLIVPKKRYDNMPDAVIEADVVSGNMQLGEVYESVSCIAAHNGLNSQIGRIRNDELDGVITSADAVKLLKLDRLHGMSYTYFEPERMVPDAGQAITALMTIRKNEVSSIMSRLNNIKSLKEYEVEQQILLRTMPDSEKEDVKICVSAIIERDNIGIYAYVNADRRTARIRKHGKLSQKSELTEKMVREINKVVEY